MHTGHRERLRGRVENEGLEGLEPHEALELLLCYAVPRRDVNETAHSLIEHFGSLRAVLSAPEEALCAQNGVGDHAARFLGAFSTLMNRCAALREEDIPLISDELTAAEAAADLPGAGPRAVQLCLDINGRLSYRRVICDTRHWGAPDALRGALKDALMLRAATVFIVVYAPDGASEEDRQNAGLYAQALTAAGVRLGGVAVTRV